MKTSARNQLQGTVIAIHRGAVNDEIELELLGGTRIVSIITHRSTEAMGLTMGSTAIALIKAPWVILATDLSDVVLSTRNVLTGTVSVLQPGVITSEVHLTLSKGGTIVAIVTNDSVAELDLKVGREAAALFKASHVILGVRRT